MCGSEERPLVAHGKQRWPDEEALRIGSAMMVFGAVEELAGR